MAVLRVRYAIKSTRAAETTVYSRRVEEGFAQRVETLDAFGGRCRAPMATKLGRNMNDSLMQYKNTKAPTEWSFSL